MTWASHAALFLALSNATVGTSPQFSLNSAMDTTGANGCSNLSWEEVLRRAERHGSLDKQCLEVLASQPGGGLAGKLAKALLSSWGESAGKLPDYESPELLEDVPCPIPDFKRELEAAGSPFILFGVKVARDGRPLVAKLVRRPGLNEGLKLDSFEECMVRFFLATRFRPAARAGHFVPATFYLGIRVCFF